MGELFGVVNIPNVVWIDEDGMIVRPAEPGWPPPVDLPDWLPSTETVDPDSPLAALGGGQERSS